jgi:hypothetical protein
MERPARPTRAAVATAILVILSGQPASTAHSERAPSETTAARASERLFPSGQWLPPMMPTLRPGVRHRTGFALGRRSKRIMIHVT